MWKPYSDIAEVTNLVLKFGEVVLIKINQLYVYPVLILGRGYPFLR